ncbi:MAG TPA: hypothetical protein VNN62_10045 [Methylomirabilota bacterium]|jgi:hypothetical protein|nr:hypothetical protein [Methylomirabilota bacterium]
MAEVIHLHAVLRARRKQREQEHIQRCIEIIGQSLQMHLAELSHAPEEEWVVRASKIRKLSELLEYTTGLL